MITAYSLMRFSFFANLDEDFVAQFVPLGVEKDLEAGDWLFRQDQEARSLYLITEGKIALTIRFRENVIDSLNPYHRGEIIGWSALVKPQMYTMGAIAETRASVIGFSGKKILELMESNRDQGYLILQNLTELISERLIDRNIQLISLRV